MNKQRILFVVLLILFLSPACISSNQPALKPPTGSSDNKTPLYPNAHKITVNDSDLFNFVNDTLGAGYFLYSSSTDVSWTEDMGTKVQKQLDNLLPEANWRLESDWYSDGQLVASTWRYGDLRVLIAYLDNLDSEQISNLERRYGLSDLQPGSTLIITHLWDTTQPVPTVTPTNTPIPSPTVTPTNTPMPSPTPPSQHILFEFPEGSNTLNPDLSWQSGGLPANSYFFGPNAGSITLIAEAGTDHFHRLELAPMILYPLEGNFETQIKVDFNPNQYYQLAGFGIRSTQDHYTWLRIAKYLTHEGQDIFFFSTNQGTTSEFKHEPYSNTTIYFKIERVGDLFTVSYSSDGNNWAVVQKDYRFGMPNAVEIFLVTYSAHNLQNITAQFSDFKVSKK